MVPASSGRKLGQVNFDEPRFKSPLEEERRRMDFQNVLVDSQNVLENVYFNSGGRSWPI